MDSKISEDELVKRLYLFLEEQSRLDNFSGAVLLAKDANSILKFSSGFANKEKQIKNTTETKFNLGSLNKMFTAVAIAQKVGKVLSDYPNSTVRKQVTIHQLLTHTSGLGHCMTDREKIVAVRKKLLSINDFVSLFKDKPLLFKPGQKYRYSGDGYELLGLIVETIANRNYYDYVKANIFKKANMFDTDFLVIDENNLRPDVAIGYKKTRESFFVKSTSSPENNLNISLMKGSAAGGAYSTVGDMLNFSQALIKNKLLDPKMTRLVTTPKVKVETKGSQTLNYGYGFQIIDIDSCRRIGHAGAFAGVSARFDTYPSLGYTLIALSNYDRPTAFRIAEKATDWITQK